MHKNTARSAVCQIVAGVLRSQRRPGLVITAHLAAVLVDHSTVGVTASAAPEPAFLRGAIVAGSPSRLAVTGHG